MTQQTPKHNPFIGYNGNQNLVKTGYVHPYTQHEWDEYINCKGDVIHFCKQYMRITVTDPDAKGSRVRPFMLWPFQEKAIRTFLSHRFVICKWPRQSGKSSVTYAYLLHYILFNKDVTVGIFAQKAKTAREILGRLKKAYELLPRWLQQGATVWNKGDIELANGSKVIADATSPSASRGFTYNIIVLDEFAHVPPHLAEEFFMSVYPTISSGITTQVIIVSTPKGMNMFHKMWVESVAKKSDYEPIAVHWSAVPGRDEAWKKKQIARTSDKQFQQEFGTEFLGSTNTLIDGAKLAVMTWDDPVALSSDESLAVWKNPEPGHVYVVVVDTSEGRGLDYSAFNVIDISTVPYEQVARYRSNMISQYMYPAVISRAGHAYNHAFVLCEVNDVGGQVANLLHYEEEYENIIKVQPKTKGGGGGQEVTPGFNQKRFQFGVKMSTSVKRIGCSNLKTLVEQDRLIIHDHETYKEFTTFVEDGQSFSADEGASEAHDDIVMSLVLFGWLTSQRYFINTTKESLQEHLKRELLLQDSADELLFGFITKGTDNVDELADPYVMGRDIWVPITEANEMSHGKLTREDFERIIPNYPRGSLREKNY